MKKIILGLYFLCLIIFAQSEEINIKNDWFYYGLSRPVAEVEIVYKPLNTAEMKYKAQFNKEGFVTSSQSFIKFLDGSLTIEENMAFSDYIGSERIALVYVGRENSSGKLGNYRKLISKFIAPNILIQVPEIPGAFRRMSFKFDDSGRITQQITIEKNVTIEKIVKQFFFILNNFYVESNEEEQGLKQLKSLSNKFWKLPIVDILILNSLTVVLERDSFGNIIKWKTINIDEDLESISEIIFTQDITYY